MAITLVGKTNNLDEQLSSFLNKPFFHELEALGFKFFDVNEDVVFTSFTTSIYDSYFSMDFVEKKGVLYFLITSGSEKKTIHKMLLLKDKSFILFAQKFEFWYNINIGPLFPTMA
jgi:hypothetical protein